MILVFGSINVDFVMRVPRLPRPGETVLGEDYFLVPGGKGANQACAAARAALRDTGAVAMIGRVGADDWADTATHLLIDAKVDTSGIARGDRPTACATIMVDDAGENAIAVASGANLEVTADQVPDHLLGPETWLVLQMEIPPEENWAVMRRARDRGARIMLNVAPAAPVPAEFLDMCDILVVNEIEARMVAGASDLVDDDPAGVARHLSEAHGLTSIVTLGGAGALAIGADIACTLKALDVTPVDTTGAGDAFVGALAAALDAGRDMMAALHWASVAAGLCCTIAGAQSSFARTEQIHARLDDLAPASRLG
jgi:ribokinase